MTTRSYENGTSVRKYNGDIVAGSLMVPESRKIARLLLQGVDRGSWRQEIIVENILQKKSPATAKRQAGLIRSRLEIMSRNLWELVANGNTEVATQAVMAAAIKHSRLLGDFMDQVVRQHIRMYDTQLSKNDWIKFMESCEQLDPDVATWTKSTRNKLREVVYRMLAEARYLEGTRSLKLTPVVVVDELRNYLLENREHYVLRCMDIHP